jgi:micrococcal nuclease
MTTWTVPATVVRIIDGDTLILDLDLGWGIRRPLERCRLGRCNAPELSTPEGVAARDYVVGLLPLGTAVAFVSKKLDNYGRPLGEVIFADGKDNLTDLLLGSGHAVPYV